MFTGRLLDAAEAASVGLVNRIVDTDQLDEAVRNLAQTIVANAPLTISATKEMVRRIQARRRLDSIQGHDLIAMCYTSHDFKEGVEAFLAKRPPQWKGKLKLGRRQFRPSRLSSTSASGGPQDAAA